MKGKEKGEEKEEKEEKERKKEKEKEKEKDIGMKEKEKEEEEEEEEEYREKQEGKEKGKAKEKEKEKEKEKLYRQTSEQTSDTGRLRIGMRIQSYMKGVTFIHEEAVLSISTDFFESLFEADFSKMLGLAAHWDTAFPQILCSGSEEGSGMSFPFQQLFYAIQGTGNKHEHVFLHSYHRGIIHQVFSKNKPKNLKFVKHMGTKKEILVTFFGRKSLHQNSLLRALGIVLG